MWAALVAALVVTASAEYELARAAGFGTYVAAGVPAALDIYAVRALRARRDVAAVVLAMVAVNAASHLVAAGLLPVSVPLVVAVSAIAPLVLWRVHRLAEHIEQVPAEQQVNTPPVQAPFTPAGVDAEQAIDRPAAGAVPAAGPLVICGGQRVYPLTVHPVGEPGGVDGGQGVRLDAEQARMVIEYAWASGVSVREAARVSTRSVSYAGKVYGRLDAEQDGPPEGAQLALVAAGVTA